MTLSASSPHASSPAASVEDFDPVTLVRDLWGHKFVIAAVCLAGGLISLALALVLPRTYQADATILPLQSAPDSTSALALGLMSQAGLPSGLFSSMQTSKVADLVEILGSRTMTGRVIKACSLETEFKGWKSREDLVKRVRGTTRIVPPGIKNSAIRIEVKGDRPELVARVANSYVDNLKDALDEMGYNRAARNKTFIERQLERNRAELARAEEALAKYQATNRIASLPETVVASIRSLGDLESQKLGAEIERKRTDELLSAMSTKVQALQLDPNAMVDLQVRKRGLAAQAGALARAQAEFQAKLASLPPKAVALARLQRDVQVANAVYLALTQQLEVAIIGASKESEAFLPLDRADVPVKPVYPKKSIFTLAGLAFGLILGGVLALLQGRRATEILIQ